MFFRPEVYDQSQVRSFDVNSLAKDAMLGDSYLAQDVLGQTYTVASGFGATSTSTLAITIASGRLYTQAQTDATAVAGGDLAADTTIIEQQAWSAAQSIVLTTAALTAGQSQWVLIQAGFTQTDTIASNDPDNGLLNFFNSANWSEPLIGPGGNGLTVPTLRTNGVILNAVYGNPAATGSQAPPNPTSGYVGLYLIDLGYGQTVVTGGQILTAGPSVGTNVPSNYSYAPFLAGLLSSHHDGNPGQAPKINLATEVQGSLPSTNLAAFPTDLNGDGYVKLPGGIVIQWGVANVSITSGYGQSTVTFPVAFPTGVFQIVAADDGEFSGTAIDGAVYGTTNGTTTNFLLTAATPGNPSLSAPTAGARFIAIGW